MLGILVNDGGFFVCFLNSWECALLLCMICVLASAVVS